MTLGLRRARRAAFSCLADRARARRPRRRRARLPVRAPAQQGARRSPRGARERGRVGRAAHAGRRARRLLGRSERRLRALFEHVRSGRVARRIRPDARRPAQRARLHFAHRAGRALRDLARRRSARDRRGRAGRNDLRNPPTGACSCTSRSSGVCGDRNRARPIPTERSSAFLAGPRDETGKEADASQPTRSEAKPSEGRQPERERLASAKARQS